MGHTNSWYGPSGWLQFLCGLLRNRAMGFGCRRRRCIADALGVCADDSCAGLGFCGLLAALLRLGLFFGTLLLVRAFEIDATLERLLDEIRAAALGAFLGNRLIVRGEVAFGVVGAAPEDVATARLPLCDVSLAALWALHAFNDVLLDVLALGVAGAGDELAVGALAQNERLA